MCVYCERRKDIKYGWNQPCLPIHNKEDISANISGNIINCDKVKVVIHDYQSSCPKLIITDDTFFSIWGDGKDGIGTIYIPIKYCLACGRKLGKD